VTLVPVKHPPRQLAHRGVVEAAAVLVEPAHLGAREARRRVLAAWSPGAAVFRLGGALLLRFPTPRPLDCARAPGIPLVRADAGPDAPLASAPLAPDELGTPPRGSIVLVRGGEVSAEVPAEREDPAAWLDLDAFAITAMTPLGAPPPAPLVAVRALADPRALLGVSAPPEERAGVLRALAEGGSARTSALSFLGAIAAALVAFLARRSAGRSASRDALATVPAADPGPSLLDRAAARLQTWLARLLVATNLAQHLGRRQAEYLARLLAMLDGGDLHEALRHAIPLGGAGGDRPTAPALGVPSPRADLSISLFRGGAGRAMFGSLDLMALLRARYRAAFERLDRDGRVEEAAFVLAELLRESGEAVAYLERHERLLLAAELAEARGLPPGVQVRQWFLAGAIDRAVLLARRHGVFADAVALLAGHPREPELRVRWAEILASAGSFAAAVDAVWPVPAARSLGLAWIEAALAPGGGAAARMLARKLALRPEAFAEVCAQARPLLEAEGAHGVAARRTLGEALGKMLGDVRARTLARPLVRALVADASRSGDLAAQRLAVRLAEQSDEALRVDLPALPARERAQASTFPAPREHVVDAADVGTMPIHDAALLPGGRIALALGEAGVRVVGPRGEALFHLDQPAHALVVSDHGDRALALAPRGGAGRIARLDLVGRRGEVWCEARIDCFARDFDGAQWVIAERGRLVVIDALEPRFTALASFDLDPQLEPPEAVGRSPSGCTLLTGSTVRRYDLPSWTLRSNRVTPYGALAASVCAVGASSTGAAVLGAAPDSPSLRLIHLTEGDPAYRAVDWAHTDTAVKPLCAALDARWVATAAGRVEGGVEVSLLDVRALQRRLVFSLGSAAQASLRLDDETLTLADDRGRLLVVDLTHGDLLHDLRV
jgi:hypothetical protein